MSEHEPARPQVQPSQAQIRSTRETLEQLGVGEDTAPPRPEADVDQEDAGLSQANVQPSAVITEALRSNDDRSALANDAENNRDSGADVLPR
jgi:hypothetical protein